MSKYDYEVTVHRFKDGKKALLETQRGKDGYVHNIDLTLNNGHFGSVDSVNLVYGTKEEFVEDLDELIGYLQGLRQSVLGE